MSVCVCVCVSVDAIRFGAAVQAILDGRYQACASWSLASWTGTPHAVSQFMRMPLHRLAYVHRK